MHVKQIKPLLSLAFSLLCFLYFQLVKESVRKFQAKHDKQDQRQANIDLLRDNQKLEEQLKAQTKSWPQVWYTASHF